MSFDNDWNTLDFWDKPEWLKAQEKLDDLDKKTIEWNPSRPRLFRALDLTPFETVRVVIIGQDPYPDERLCTGAAFSIPSTIKTLPPTLVNILEEYQTDLHYPKPKTGDLTPWCKEGVLLWNAYPTCLRGNPASHRWSEWECLTQEIVERTSKKGVVFTLLGAYARGFERSISSSSEVFTSSHPSPLAATKSTPKVPAFLGSRMFTTVNSLLCEMKLSKIDWRLD